MAKIRDLNPLDIFKINKMISYLNIEKSMFDNLVLPFPFNLPYKLLSLKFRFLPENYVLIDKKKPQACVSLKSEHGNYKKWRFIRIFMGENAYEEALLLVQYAIGKLGAKGAHTFLVSLDDSQSELADLFINGVGFRQCSHQQIWKCDKFNAQNADFEGLRVRPFKNSDAQGVANVFNESVFSHFRPSLSRDKAEFHEYLFSGLNSSSEFKYVIEDRRKKMVLGYFSLKVNQSKKYFLNIVLSKGYETLFDGVMSFAYAQALRRTKEFEFYVLNKHYLQTADYFEKRLVELDFKFCNKYIVLVKDLFRTIKDESLAKSAVLFTDIGSNPAFEIFND